MDFKIIYKNWILDILFSVIATDFLTWLITKLSLLFTIVSLILAFFVFMFLFYPYILTVLIYPQYTVDYMKNSCVIQYTNIVTKKSMKRMTIEVKSNIYNIGLIQKCIISHHIRKKPIIIEIKLNPSTSYCFQPFDENSQGCFKLNQEGKVYSFTIEEPNFSETSFGFIDILVGITEKKQREYSFEIKRNSRFFYLKKKVLSKIIVEYKP